MIGKFNNLIGNKYHMLTVLSREPNTKGGEARWLCLCDCGNTHKVTAGPLTKGKITNCGCIRKEKLKLTFGLSAKNMLIRTYKWHAKERNLLFELSYDELIILFEGNCFYCDTKPEQKILKQRMNGSFIYNGIDRINNELGYIKDNVVSCCKKCNIAKNNYSIEEFLSWLLKVTKNINSIELKLLEAKTKYVEFDQRQ